MKHYEAVLWPGSPRAVVHQVEEGFLISHVNGAARVQLRFKSKEWAEKAKDCINHSTLVQASKKRS